MNRSEEVQTIIHLIFSLETGGAENLLIDIVNEQVQQSRVTVIIINNKIEKNLINRIDKRVRVRLLDRRPGSKLNFIFVLKLWKLLFFTSADVIHCHNANSIPLIPFFRNRAVITLHDVGLPKYNLRKFRKVFSISNAVSEDLKKNGIPSKVIPNGINFSEYSERKNYFFNEDDPFKIVQVSRLIHEKKGQDVLIHALDILIKRYGVTNCHIDFVGSGPSERYLKELTKKLDLMKYINFLNNQDRLWVQQNLCNYELLIQPSRTEGFGLTVVEAIASGIPVIASNIEGPAEILDNIPSGFLFKSEDADQLSEQLEKVISLYRSNKIENLCAVSHELIEERYSVQKTANEYLKSYKMQ